MKGGGISQDLGKESDITVNPPYTVAHLEELANKNSTARAYSALRIDGRR